MIVFKIIYHSHLLLVEKFPNFENVFEMITSNSVEMTLLDWELFLVLLFQNLEVKIKKSHYFWSVLSLKTVNIIKKIIKCLE